MAKNSKRGQMDIVDQAQEVVRAYMEQYFSYEHSGSGDDSGYSDAGRFEHSHFSWNENYGNKKIKKQHKPALLISAIIFLAVAIIVGLIVIMF